MWWFLKKSERLTKADLGSQTQTVSKQSLAEDALLAQVPDLVVLDDNSEVVKIWLPEEVAQTMKWSADYEGLSQSEWLRARLVTYLYGSVALLAQKIRRERDRGFHGVRFCRTEVDRSAGRWVYKVPQLGKNTVAFKLWLSQQMRNDLAVLAKHAGVSMSPFIREALIGDLYGRGSLPERPGIMGVATAAALAWERGEEVAVADLEEATFNGLGESQQVWVADVNGKEHF